MIRGLYLSISPVLFRLMAVALLLLSCGGSKPGANVPTAEKNIEDDPLGLLPAPAIAVAVLDAKALFANPSFGKDFAAFVEKFTPVGEEVGFKASRDLDQLTLATYSLQGIDVLGVMHGTFDPQKIKDYAAKHGPVKSGGTMVVSNYAGKDIYTVNNFGLAVLSSSVVLTGTEGAIRRSLDRVRDQKKGRDIPSWMIDTLETKDSAFALAADMGNQVVNLASPLVQIDALGKMKTARFVGNFKDPGINVAGAATYPDPDKAAAAKDQLDKLKKFLPLLAAMRMPQPRNLDVKVAQSDVQITFALDGNELKTFFAESAPLLMPR
jgi:hypothetical protein